MIRGRASYATFIAACVLSGCAHGSVPSVADQGVLGGAVAVFKVRVPAVGGASKPAFIGADTESLSLAIDTTGGANVTSATVNVTPTSAGCSQVAGATECTESVIVAPGAYVASVAAYDGLNATGNLLSKATSVSFTAPIGVATVVPLTLYGVPHALSISKSSSTLRGTSSRGFTAFGLGAESFTVTVTDADGETIVGAGAPTITAAVSNSAFAIAQATGTSNSFSVTPSGYVYTAASMSVQLSFGDSTVCSESGAACSASTTIAALPHVIAVETSSGVSIYTTPLGGSAVASISLVPRAITFDAAGDLLASFATSGYSCPCGVTAYAPPYTGTPTTISLPVGGADLLADDAGRIFAAGYTSTGAAIVEASSPYTSYTTISAAYDCACNLAEDSFGNFFVATHGGCAMSGCYALAEFPPPYTSSKAIGRSKPGIYDGLAVNASNEVIAVFSYNSANDLDVFTAGATTASSSIQWSCASCSSTIGQDTYPLLTSSGDYIQSFGGTVALDVASPYTSTSTLTKLVGTSASDPIAIDGSDDIFVTTSSGVTEYSPPYSSAAASMTLSGVSHLAATP